MARIARIVVPGYPHHVTQRGNRKQRTFFCPEDYSTYIHLLAAAKANADAEIWAYCLMPNHVHLVVIPHHEESLVALFKEAHRKYTRRINEVHGWKGHLWQERFHSVVMDESHLINGVRYVERNPVEANLCGKPEEWPWSSATAHLARTDDPLVTVAPMLDRIQHWRSYLHMRQDESVIERIQKHSQSGRPLGTDDFIVELEAITGRNLTPGKRGRKPHD
jgi:putative transposase